MAITVDTSTILCVALNEPNRPGIIALTVGEELIAPGPCTLRLVMHYALTGHALQYIEFSITAANT